MSSAPAPEITRANPVKAFLKMVAIEHSVFALPFAYLATLTAMRLNPADDGSWMRWDVLVLVTVAMVAARTLAMAANRIIDRHIDARNPRTASRELVTGAVSLRTAYVGCAVSLVIFLGSAALLNPLCLVLSPLAVAPLIIYPYAKRFTDVPHAVLGLAQMVAPVGAWLAVTGTFDGAGPAIVLGFAVGLWIGAFDLIYACQDSDFDREHGVRSTPARYGIAVALHASTISHAITWLLLLWFGIWTEFGFFWWIGLAIVGVTLVWEHAIVKPHDLSKVNRAFFTANGLVAIVLFLVAALDLLFR